MSGSTVPVFHPRSVLRGNTAFSALYGSPVPPLPLPRQAFFHTLPSVPSLSRVPAPDKEPVPFWPGYPATPPGPEVLLQSGLPPSSAGSGAVPHSPAVSSVPAAGPAPLRMVSSAPSVSVPHMPPDGFRALKANIHTSPLSPPSTGKEGTSGTAHRRTPHGPLCSRSGFRLKLPSRRRYPINPPDIPSVFPASEGVLSPPSGNPAFPYCAVSASTAAGGRFASSPSSAPWRRCNGMSC